MNAKVLYIIDDASRNGGAHVATRKLIRTLRDAGHQVDLFCETPPTSEQVVEMGCPSVYVARIRYHSVKWFVCGLWRKIVRSLVYPKFFLDPLRNTRRLMRGYEVVCVMSEGSIFRNIVSSLPTSVRKVQMIHTNYHLWREHVKSSQLVTYKDGVIYPRMDAIGVVGRIGSEEFKNEFRVCRSKVLPFYNMINVDQPKCAWHKSSIPRLVTIARVEDKGAKDGARMLRVARRIKDRGIAFKWDIYGSSERSKEKYNLVADEQGMSECLKVHGYSSEVYCHMSNADIVVLLSHYEGLPNVVYESFQAGTPVFATSVGGIPEQIREGYNGWLVADDEEEICERLIQVLLNQAEIYRLRKNLSDYKYENAIALRSHMKLLGIEGL